jgi:hypothetical protein
VKCDDCKKTTQDYYDIELESETYKIVCVGCYKEHWCELCDSFYDDRAEISYDKDARGHICTTCYAETNCNKEKARANGDCISCAIELCEYYED